MIQSRKPRFFLSDWMESRPGESKKMTCEEGNKRECNALCLLYIQYIIYVSLYGRWECV